MSMFMLIVIITFLFILLDFNCCHLLLHPELLVESLLHLIVVILIVLVVVASLELPHKLIFIVLVFELLKLMLVAFPWVVVDAFIVATELIEALLIKVVAVWVVEI